MIEPSEGLPALVIAIITQAAAGLIWGASLTQRVRRLEDEVRPLKAMPEKIARIEERIDSLIEQFRDLNAAIRWMRDPATDLASGLRRRD